MTDISKFNKPQGLGKWISREFPEGRNVPPEKNLSKYLTRPRRGIEISEEEKAEEFKRLWS